MASMPGWLKMSARVLKSARGAGHDALRIGLVDGKQRDH